MKCHSPHPVRSTCCQRLITDGVRLVQVASVEFLRCKITAPTCAVLLGRESVVHRLHSGGEDLGSTLEVAAIYVNYLGFSAEDICLVS